MPLKIERILLGVGRVGNREPYNALRDCPGGPVVKNLTANAGDTGSIPGPGRPH